MSAPMTSFEAQCTEVLRDHLEHGDEQTLHAAYELARRGLADGLGVVDMAAMLQRALRENLDLAGAPAVPQSIAARFEALALECFSPFEMAHRGAREANAVLRRMNERHEEDMRRIAHELHDSAGQLLATVHFALDDAARALGPGAGISLDRVRARLEEVERELRRLSHELRPTVLDHVGLLPALHQLGEGVTKRSRVAVRIHGETAERLPAPIETALYRVVQEALMNAARHAGAKRVDVVVACRGDSVHCRVSDDGVGFDPTSITAAGAGGGIGLAGMAERLVPLGGSLRIDSGKGRGATLEITIPLEVPHAAPNPAC